MTIFKKITLELQPDTFQIIKDATVWYHECLHMQVDPEKYDPDLPIEVLTRAEKKRRIIKMHSLLKDFEGVQ